MTKREVNKSSYLGEVKHRPKNRKGFYMNENENLVTEEEVEVTENVEETTEETPEKIYTEKEFNDRVNEKVREVTGRRLARKEAQIRKEYEAKYGDLETVLKAGMGKEDVGEITHDLREFYTKNKKIDIPKRADYSAKDIETLATAEANEIISAGFEDVVDEVDRLTAKGVANMTAREKHLFKALAEYRQKTEQTSELAKLGVTADVYESKDFKEFASMCRSDVPITKVYEQYAKTQPKKEFKTMGSMKQSPGKGAKDFYTEEEISRLTEEDLKDPKVWESVRRSMTGR